MLIFEHSLNQVYNQIEKSMKRQLFVVLVCMTMFAVTSCGEKKGKDKFEERIEKAKESVEDVMDDAKDQIEDKADEDWGNFG